MSGKKFTGDYYHAIGFEENQQHLDKSERPTSKEAIKPEAGVKGEEGSRVSGQGGAELLGGSASTRILGQSVGDQLTKPLPPTNEQ